jgi:hypothetical protein
MFSLPPKEFLRHAAAPGIAERKDGQVTRQRCALALADLL